MEEIIYHILAVSVLLNLWLLAYSIPKIRREKEYWKRRSTWYERYMDDKYEEWENISGTSLEPRPDPNDLPLE